MKFLSAGKQVPTVFQLLPFQTPEKPAATTTAATEAGAVQIYEFTPSATELLNELLPAAVKAMLFQIFNDAIVSEHVSRMVAMKAATTPRASSASGTRGSTTAHARRRSRPNSPRSSRAPRRSSKAPTATDHAQHPAGPRWRRFSLARSRVLAASTS